jgi:glycerol-3-phosphate dehydrogenase
MKMSKGANQVAMMTGIDRMKTAMLAGEVLDYLSDYQRAVASVIEQAQEAGAEQRIAARFSRALA